uniref:RNA-directed RNA polymerase L n=1 Tax=Leptomonas pyrrhocoris leishbunyavirus 4 TaxID=3070842 RepID=A0AA50KIW1_9VIRU|nr:RNA-dependent RNA polymerase [Leptomonas pyrrhocoris leishbunyavirus 4]
MTQNFNFQDEVRLQCLREFPPFCTDYSSASITTVDSSTVEPRHAVVQERGSEWFVECGDLRMSARRDQHYSYPCHEMFCMAFFEAREVQAPSHLTYGNEIVKLLDRAPRLTPDNIFAYHNILYITELKTSVTKHEDADLMQNAITKYADIYPPGSYKITGISLTQYMLKFRGLIPDVNRARDSYAVWLGCIRAFQDFLGYKRSILNNINNVDLAEFPVSELTYDSSWISTLEDLKSRELGPYCRKMHRIHTDYEPDDSLFSKAKWTELTCCSVEYEGDFYIPSPPTGIDERRRKLILEVIRNSKTFSEMGTEQLDKEGKLKPCVETHKMKINISSDDVSPQDREKGLDAKSFAAEYTQSQSGHLSRESFKMTLQERIDSTRMEATLSYLDDQRELSHKSVLAPTDFNVKLLSDDLFKPCKHPLYDKSVKLWPEEDYPETYGDFSLQGTVLFSQAMFIQRLVQELNVVRTSSSGKLIHHVSKIGPYDAYLLAHATGRTNHIFYDILFKGEPCECLCKDLFLNLNDGWWMTSVVRSINSSRLNQLLFMTHKLACLYEFFKRYGEENAKQYITISYLTMLDGKQHTIDMLQYFRYLYMKQTCYYDDLSPVLKKCISPIRTKLQSLIAYRMIMVKNNFLTQRAKLAEDEDGQITVNHMINWVIPTENIDSVEEMISLSYMHYCVAAKKNDTIHGYIKCLNKIVLQELELPISYHELKNSTEEFLDRKKLTHEYSRPIIKRLGEFLSGWLKQSSISPKTVLSMFLKSCAENITFQKFSTMKKSTEFHDGIYDRIQCALAVRHLMQKHNYSGSPMDNITDLSRSLGKIENRAVSVFKKDQQTGIREIFVMPIAMRISMAICEEFCRVIANHVPNEMLTKPQLKDSLDAIHLDRVRDAKRQCQLRDMVQVIHVTSSADAKTWCQRWVMPNFLDFMISFLRDYLKDEKDTKILDSYKNMENHFINTFNSITHKCIIPDSNHMKTISIIPDSVIFDDVVRALKGVINQDPKYDNIRGEIPGSIKNMSNMMQGVPHVMSSLLHSTYLNYMTTHMESFILRRFTEVVLCKISSQVSSDDSSLICTVCVKESTKPEEIRRIRRELCVMLGIIEETKTEIGAESSPEKSTIGTMGKLREFNSCWKAGSTSIYAGIKFMSSVFSLGFHPILRDRVSESLSSLQQLYKEGLYTREIACINKALQLAHAELLAPPETIYYTKLLETNCPDLGVVPYLPPKLIGYLSLELLDILVMKRLKERKSYFSMRNKTPSLTFDKMYKYLEFVKKMGIDRSSLVQRAEGMDPISFLEEGFPSEDDEISVAMLSSGIRLSFMNVDLLRIHTASSYTMGNAVVSYYDDNVNKVDFRKTPTKTSLFDLINESLSYRGDYELLSTSYQNSLAEQIDTILDVRYNLELKDKSYCPRKRHEVTLVTSAMPIVGAKDTILSCWKNGGNLEMFRNNNKDAYIRQLETIDYRFKRTFEETRSNFGDIISLRMWLDSVVEKRKKVEFLISRKPQFDRIEAVQRNLRENYSHNQSYCSMTSINYGDVYIAPDTEYTEEQSKAVIEKFNPLPIFEKYCTTSLMPFRSNRKKGKKEFKDEVSQKRGSLIGWANQMDLSMNTIERLLYTQLLIRDGGINSNEISCKVTISSSDIRREGLLYLLGIPNLRECDAFVARSYKMLMGLKLSWRCYFYFTMIGGKFKDMNVGDKARLFKPIFEELEASHDLPRDLIPLIMYHSDIKRSKKGVNDYYEMTIKTDLSIWRKLTPKCTYKTTAGNPIRFVELELRFSNEKPEVMTRSTLIEIGKLDRIPVMRCSNGSKKDVVEVTLSHFSICKSRNQKMHLIDATGSWIATKNVFISSAQIIEFDPIVEKNDRDKFKKSLLTSECIAEQWQVFLNNCKDEIDKLIKCSNSHLSSENLDLLELLLYGPHNPEYADAYGDPMMGLPVIEPTAMDFNELDRMTELFKRDETIEEPEDESVGDGLEDLNVEYFIETDDGSKTITKSMTVGYTTKFQSFSDGLILRSSRAPKIFLSNVRQIQNDLDSRLKYLILDPNTGYGGKTVIRKEFLENDPVSTEMAVFDSPMENDSSPPDPGGTTTD